MDDVALKPRKKMSLFTLVLLWAFEVIKRFLVGRSHLDTIGALVFRVFRVQNKMALDNFERITEKWIAFENYSISKLKKIPEKFLTAFYGTKICINYSRRYIVTALIFEKIFVGWYSIISRCFENCTCQKTNLAISYQAFRKLVSQSLGVMYVCLWSAILQTDHAKIQW